MAGCYRIMHRCVHHVYYANAPSERRLVVVDENGASGDFKKFYLAEPFQEGAVVLKIQKKPRNIAALKLNIACIREKLFLFAASKPLLTMKAWERVMKWQPFPLNMKGLRIASCNL